MSRLADGSNRGHFRRLCEVPFDTLAHLDLGTNSLEPDHLHQLLRNPAGRRLRVLNLEGHAVGDEGLKQPAEAAGLRREGLFLA
jgi:hypothetical protein